MKLIQHMHVPDNLYHSALGDKGSTSASSEGPADLDGGVTNECGTKQAVERVPVSHVTAESEAERPPAGPQLEHVHEVIRFPPS